MSILNQIANLLIPRNADSDKVAEVKREFIHKSRLCRYGRWKLKVDSLVGEAAPGVLETIISELETDGAANTKRLLNLGGGIGQLSDIFSYMGYDVFNTDINIKKTDARNLKVDFNKTSDLPVEKASFDYIVCQEVIEHVENPWSLLRLARKYIKDDGLFLLTTPNIHSHSSKKIFRKTEHFRWFTPECLSYHVNPLPYWEVLLIAERVGFSLRIIKGNANYFVGRPSRDADISPVLKYNDVLIYIFAPTKI